MTDGWFSKDWPNICHIPKGQSCGKQNVWTLQNARLDVLVRSLGDCMYHLTLALSKSNQVVPSPFFRYTGRPSRISSVGSKIPLAFLMRYNHPLRPQCKQSQMLESYLTDSRALVPHTIKHNNYSLIIYLHLFSI